MKSAPTAVPQREPSPATAAPIRSWSESNEAEEPRLGVAVRDEDVERARDARVGGGDAEGEGLVDRQRDAGRGRRDLAVTDGAERPADPARGEAARPRRTRRRRMPQCRPVHPELAASTRGGSRCCRPVHFGPLQRQLRDRDREGERRQREVDAREAERGSADDDTEAEAIRSAAGVSRSGSCRGRGTGSRVV